MAAAPSLNQLYISERALSKAAQLLLKTATFYFVPSPGLSLLFPLCRRSRSPSHVLPQEEPRRSAVAWGPPLSPLSSSQRNGEAAATGGRAQACGGVGGWGEGSIFKALFACCSVPVCVNGGGRVIREPGWAALRAAPRHKDDTV